MIFNEEQQRDSIACALLRGYGLRGQTAHEEIEQLYRLRQLQNKLLCENRAECRVLVNLTAFYEEVFTAAELCLAGSGYSVDITGYADFNVPFYVKINQRNLAHAIMNLLANALEKSVDKAARIRGQSFNGRMLLRIENKGKLEWEKVRSGFENKGRGLCAAQDVVLKNGAQLILAQCCDICCAAVILPEHACQNNQPTEPLDCADLLFDRTSPVHVGLAKLTFI